MRTSSTVATTDATAVTVIALAGAAPPVTAHGNHLSADPQVSTDGTLVVESVLPIEEAWIVVLATALAARSRRDRVPGPDVVTPSARRVIDPDGGNLNSLGK